MKEDDMDVKDTATTGGETTSNPTPGSNVVAHDTSKKRVLINGLASVTSWSIQFGIAFFLTPFLLHRLGDDVYSLVPLVNSCVVYLAVLMLGLCTAIGRYVMVHLVREEWEAVNEYMSTAFFIIIIMAMVMTGMLVLLVVFMPMWFKIPAGYETQGRLVMGLMGADVIRGLLTSVFGVGIYARQRLFLDSTLRTLGAVVRVIIIVGYFLLVDANVVVVAVGLLAAGLVNSVGTLILCRRLIPTLRISRRLVRWSRVRDLVSFGFYSILTQVGSRMLFNAPYMVINILIGTAMVSHFNVGMQVPNTVMMMVWAMVGVMTPTATALDEEGSKHRIANMLSRSVRYSMIILGPPVVVAAVLARPFLVTWVGSAYVDATWVLVMMMVAALHATLSYPCSSILIGTGHIKLPAIVTVVAGVVSVLLSILFGKVFDWGITGVALALLIVVVMKDLIMFPLYTVRILKCSPWLCYREFLFGVLVLIIPGGVALAAGHWFDLAGWSRLITVGIVGLVPMIPVAYFLYLNRHDRADVRSALNWLRAFVTN